MGKVFREERDESKPSLFSDSQAMFQARESDIDLISGAICQILDGRIPAPIELPADTPGNEIRQLADYVNKFLEQYRILADAVLALSRGDVESEVPKCKLHVCQFLKNLQANLRHLTWKTQQIANGDFTQRVDFLGEFSKSFNSMVEILATNREELLRRNQELETASRTDFLTGLLNRRGAWEAMKCEAARSIRTGRTFALILADIDHFKKTNDIYGHDAGDAMLVEVASTVRTQVRTQDFCSRWGGEEFLILATETDLPGAVAVAERVRFAIEAASVTHGGRTAGVTISAGGSLYQGGEDIDACLKRADICLYEAKESGQNRVCSRCGPGPEDRANARQAQPQIRSTVGAPVFPSQ